MHKTFFTAGGVFWPGLELVGDGIYWHFTRLGVSIAFKGGFFQLHAQLVYMVLHYCLRLYPAPGRSCIFRWRKRRDSTLPAGHVGKALPATASLTIGAGAWLVQGMLLLGDAYILPPGR